MGTREENEDNSFGLIVYGSWFAPLNFIDVVINDMGNVAASQRSRSPVGGDRDRGYLAISFLDLVHSSRAHLHNDFRYLNQEESHARY